MLIKLARNLTGGVNRLNPLIMRGNIRYLDLTSKVHLKGALGYISLGGSGGLLVHACLSRTPPSAQTHRPSVSPPIRPPLTAVTASIQAKVTEYIFCDTSLQVPSANNRLLVNASPRLTLNAHHLPAITPKARIITKITPKLTPTSPAIGHRRSGTVTHKTTHPLHLPHPHPSLQRHFYLLSLPLLAVFLPIGLTETKAKKGINGTSLTNFNISPRFALWR